MADKYINRDKLLEAYGDCIVTYCLQPKHGIFPTYGETGLWDYIKTMPTIEAEPTKHGRWIPVTEALPETHKEPCIFQESYECSDPVLVYLSEPYDDSDVCIAVYDKGDATFLRYGWEERFTGEEVHVVAWMPLPEPYKMDESTMGQVNRRDAVNKEANHEQRID